MAFVTAMFVMFYIKERVSRAKLLQFVSGVNKVIFWMTSFVVDYLVFILITLVYIGILAAYQEEGYSTITQLARNLLVLVIFGFSALPFTYVLSFMFQIPSTGLVRLAIGYIISGVFFFMAYFILDNELLNLSYIAKPLGWIFLIFPHYSLARAMSNMNILQSTLSSCKARCDAFPECRDSGGVDGLCEQFDFDCSDASNQMLKVLCSLKDTCCDKNYYSFNEDGIGMNLVALVLIAIVSFIVLFALEYRWIQNLFFQFKKEQR